MPLLLLRPLLLLLAPTPAGDYQPYVPPASEAVSAPLFVVIAYAAIWVVLVIFLASVWRRQRRVEQELRDLEQRLERTASGPSGR